MEYFQSARGARDTAYGSYILQFLIFEWNIAKARAERAIRFIVRADKRLFQASQYCHHAFIART
jgi:hypothetical protein